MRGSELRISLMFADDTSFHLTQFHVQCATMFEGGRFEALAIQRRRTGLARAPEPYDFVRSSLKKRVSVRSCTTRCLFGHFRRSNWTVRNIDKKTSYISVGT